MGVIVGQKINPKKIQRAKELRQAPTSAEETLWFYLRNRKLNGLHFRRQQVISGFIVDFYCHAAKLAVEVDGEIHDFKTDYDSERDRLLALEGIEVLHIKNEAVKGDIYQVLKQIASASQSPSNQ